MTIITHTGDTQYTEDDAFCALADVEALVQRGSFTGSTHPTAQQVLDWMGRYAAQVESVLADNQIEYTVASRGNPFPDSGTDASVSRLQSLCEAANAIAAAAQAIEMLESKDSGDGSGKAAEMMKEFEALLEQIVQEALIDTSPAPIFGAGTSTDLRFLSDTEF